MIVRIGRGHIRPGTWNDFERAYTNLVEGERPPGLRARWLGRDVDDEHGGFTVAIWDSAEAASAWFETEAFAHAQAEMRPYFLGDYQVHTCEIRVHEQVTD